MAEVFVGQMMLVGFNFAPRGFALCQGQLLPISTNTALFSLLGTTFGGDGKTSFGLPDLRGRGTMGKGQSTIGTEYVMGEAAGEDSVTLLSASTPQHMHTVSAARATSSDASTPNGNGLGFAPLYSNSQANLTNMSQTAVTPFGGNQPHINLMPYLTLNWIIALQGIFPPRS